MNWGPPKPLERVIRAAAYACVGLSGVWFLLFARASISSALGHILTPIWACFLLAALPAALATILGRYRAEYACLPWFAGALVLAVIWEWLRVAHGFSSPPRSLINTALSCLFIVRFISLHQLVKVRVRGRNGWTSGSK